MFFPSFKKTGQKLLFDNGIIKGKKGGEKRVLTKTFPLWTSNSCQGDKSAVKNHRDTKTARLQEAGAAAALSDKPLQPLKRRVP